MSSITCLARHVAFAVGVLALASVASPAQSLSYIGGVQYATGDFIFTQRTWSTYLSNGLSWSAGHVRASASVPLVMQPAGWLQYNGAGMMVPTGGITGTAGRPASSSSAMGNAMNGGTMAPASDMPFSQVGIGDPVGRIDVVLSRGDIEQPQVSLVGDAPGPGRLLQPWTALWRKSGKHRRHT